MKKFIILLGVATVSLTSCLKDKPNVDFSKIGTFAEIVHSGSPYFGESAITESQDTITRQLEVNITGLNAPKSDVQVTVEPDNSLISPYNSAHTDVTYEALPADAYVFSKTTLTIKAGTRIADVPVTFYKKKLDPSKSYMLPIKITNVSTGVTLSTNFNVKYYHFIGNDFAGTYEHYYDRWAKPDSSGTKDHDHEDKGQITFFPVNPTEFTVTTFYYTQPPYHVTFKKTGSGTSATYSNFKVDFTAADVNEFFGTNVTLVKHPEIRPMNNVNYDPNKQYTYAEALKLFRFFYTTATRAVIDTYVKK